MADISNALGVYVFSRHQHVHGAAQIHYQLDVAVTFAFSLFVRCRRWNVWTPVRCIDHQADRSALGHFHAFCQPFASVSLSPMHVYDRAERPFARWDDNVTWHASDFW